MENEFPTPPLPTPEAPETAQVLAPTPAAPVPASFPAAPEYRDRKTGLLIFGIVQIILGLLAALMVPFVVLGAFMSRLTPGGAMRPSQFISGVVTYALIAVAFLTLGIGSVQTKRWARALTLVTSWYWLVIGALATVAMTAILPVAMRGALAQAQQSSANPPSADITTGVMAVMITLMIVFFTVFLVLLPIAFVVFYRREDVELTCRHRDPVQRWTDRTPLPVLGVSVAFFVGSLYTVLLAVTMPMLPLFGHFLTGIPAAGCLILLAGLDFYLAIALFRLRLSGWWIAVVAAPLRMAAAAFSYSRAGLMQAYAKMGWSEAQLQMLNSNPIFHSRIFLGMGVIMMLAFFGYLLWIKRYLKTPVAPTPTEALATPTI